MKNKIQLIFIIFLSLVLTSLCLLRFVNLGYSEFQGDEISAQNYLFDHQNLWQFLMTRTIGPMQYLVTFAINSWAFTNSSNPEFWVRLPFAVASIFGVVGVFVMVRKHFGIFEALGSSIFMAGSGLLFAFSRFAQYQSFVICLGIWAMHLFLNSSKKDASPKSLILPSVLSAIALLFHYDALTFIFPIYLLLFLEEFPKIWEKKNTFFKSFLKSKIWYFSFPLLLLNSIFYLPYIFNPKFKSTFNYLFLERISSDTKFDAIFYSTQIMSLYHPSLFLILIILFILFLSFYKFQKFSNFQKISLTIFYILLFSRFTNVDQNLYLTFGSTFSFVLLVFSFRKKILERENNFKILLFWFLFSFLFYGLFIAKPMTHIYTFLVPLLIILPIFILKFLKDRLYLFAISFISLLLLSFNYLAFVDNQVEFPWNSKNFFLESKISIYDYSFRFDGVFGFPYRRSWDRVADFLEDKKVTRYFSNEKYRVTKYYLRNFKYDELTPEVYIYIKNPQSLSITSPDSSYTLLIENRDFQIYKLNY